MTSSFDAVFDFIVNGIKWVYDTLDKVTFHGISLLDFFITLFVLGIAVPLVVSTVTARTSGGDYSKRDVRGGRDEVHGTVDH